MDNDKLRFTLLKQLNKNFMKKIFLLVVTCMVSYLALAGECSTYYCSGGDAKCCVTSGGDTYYQCRVIHEID